MSGKINTYLSIPRKETHSCIFCVYNSELGKCESDLQFRSQPLSSLDTTAVTGYIYV